MYDAINKGLGKSRGDICLQLNCDEQLLPGALQRVAEFFANHPKVDIAFGGSVVVDANGNYICTRAGIVPWQILTDLQHMSTLTCATFFSRKFIEKHSLYFDPRYCGAGDSDWLRRAIHLHARLVKMPFLTSAFFDTGKNLCLSPEHRAETAAIRQRWPFVMRLLYPFLVTAHRARRFLLGDYSRGPFDYEIYTPRDPIKRTRFHVPRATGVWWNR